MEPARKSPLARKVALKPVTPRTAENERWLDRVRAFYTPKGDLVGFVVETLDEFRFVAVPYRGLHGLGPTDGEHGVTQLSATTDLHARQLVDEDRAGHQMWPTWHTRAEAEHSFLDFLTSDYNCWTS